MRQVPEIPKYLLIGGGRLARHLAHYFNLLEVPFQQWVRETGTTAELIRSIKSQTHILLCIKDDALKNLYQQFNEPQKTFIHFSGSQQIPGIHGFHPLMSFGQGLYDLSTYKNIHFAGIDSPEFFIDCFPDFTNHYSQLNSDQMRLYHSLCVLSGNGTTLLWDLVGKQFESMGLPQEALKPYLNRITANILEDQPGRWSGPWYRKDHSTITQNKEALKDRELIGLYAALEELSSQAGHKNEKRA